MDIWSAYVLKYISQDNWVFAMMIIIIILFIIKYIIKSENIKLMPPVIHIDVNYDCDYN